MGAGPGRDGDRKAAVEYLPASLPHELAPPARLTEFSLPAHGIIGALARTGEVAAFRVANLRDRLAALAIREAELGSLFNFVPVILGVGICIYFALPAEPVRHLPALSALLLAIAAFRLRVHGPLFHGLVAGAVLFTGLALAQHRVETAGGPAVREQMRAQLRAIVVDAGQNRRGSPRYLLRPVHVEGLAPEELPRLVRLSSASRHTPFVPGDTIEGVATLQPLSGPAYPGGFDFGFSQWFDGIGATGFFTGAPVLAAPAERNGFGEEATIAVNRVRGELARRIRAGLPGEPGDIAVALITGDRTGLDEDTQESLRKSGLAHILAISGLHMALVTLTVIGAMRYVLACVPGLALRHPVRKWAAAAGFASATAYLLLSGASVATQRAYVMIAVMLFALLIDRRALTMRNVAIAAIIVLVMSPEALLEPGFQMSFSAAGALVAAYGALTQWQRARRARREPRLRWDGLVWRLVAGTAGLAFTSLVAGLATGLYSAWHFHRVAPLGLLSNLAAMPIVSFAVMPLALLSALLMPYGMERLALAPLGLAIETVVRISDWVNTFPAPSITGAQPLAVILLGSAGLVTLVALSTRLRLLGIVPLAAAGMAATAQAPPDLVISQDGRAAAMRDADGKLALLYPRRNAFASGIWLRAWSRDEAGNAASLGAACDKDYCAAVTPDGTRIAIVYAPARIAQACASADVLVAPRLRWIRCQGRTPKLVLKRDDFERGGAHSVQVGKTGARGRATITASAAIKLPERPWNAARLPPLREEEGGKRFSTAGSGRPAFPAPSRDPD